MPDREELIEEKPVFCLHQLVALHGARCLTFLFLADLNLLPRLLALFGLFPFRLLLLIQELHSGLFEVIVVYPYYGASVDNI